VKAHIGSLVALMTWFGSTAHAVYAPNWERPVLRADLQELAANGGVINYSLKKSLTLNKRDGARQATTYTLTEERRVQCFRAPCPPMKHTRTFRIQGPAVEAGCGSRRLTAVEIAPVGLTDFPAGVLTVIDHSTRRCDDFQPYRWRVTLSGRRDGRRTFGGNPEPVYTIMSGN
jgi:hypothetical protein